MIADPYNCAGSQIINPPTNISNPWVYPSTWINKGNPPQYAGGQNCTWTINVPKGMFAIFTLQGITDVSSLLTMQDSVDYVTKFTISDSEPFFLMDPFFVVNLQANTNGTLGMEVRWNPINSGQNSTTYNIHPNSSPLPLFGGDFEDPVIIQSDTQVSLLATLPSIIITDMAPFMRITQVFDGPSINSTHLGNLYQVMASNKNLISSGKSLTLYSLQAGFSNIGYAVILQDYADVKQFNSSYKAINCISILNYCDVKLDASAGTAAAIRYYGLFYVDDFSMPDTNVISVYNDYVTPLHKLADYTSSISKTNTPQKFSGKFTTFVLNKDQATLRMSSAEKTAEWNTAFDSRRGFFTSGNYGLNSSIQNIADQITASKLTNISFTVDRTAIIGGASLTVKITSEQKTVLNNVYTTSNFPGGILYTIGDSISVKYDSNGAVSTGPFVSFGFDRYSSAACNGIFITIIMAIWMGLSL